MKVTTLFGTFALMMLALASWHSPTQAMVMTIADYQFTGPSLSPTIAAPGVAISDMAVSTGTITLGTTVPSPGSGVPDARASGFNQVNYTNYYTFTVDANAGHWLDLTGLDFYAHKPGAGTAPSRATYSIDGGSQTSIFTAALVGEAWAPYGGDLSITKEAGEIEVRLWAKAFASSTTTYRIDDVKLTGRVGAIMALFNFNDMTTRNDGTTLVTEEYVNGTPMLMMVEEGIGLDDSDGQNGTSFTDIDGDVHTAGQAAAWTTGILGNDNNDYFTLGLDTTGYEDLELRFDYRSTFAGTVLGPTELTLEYAVGGGSFNPIETITLTRDSSYHEYIKSLADISALESASGVQIRGMWSTDATGGSGRIDNLQLTGYLIPEPSTLMLLAIGLMALAGGHRWKRRRCG